MKPIATIRFPMTEEQISATWDAWNERGQVGGAMIAVQCLVGTCELKVDILSKDHADRLVALIEELKRA